MACTTFEVVLWRNESIDAHARGARYQTFTYPFVGNVDKYLRLDWVYGADRFQGRIGGRGLPARPHATRIARHPFP